MAFLISRGYSQRLSCRVVGLSRSAYNRAKALSRTGNARGDDEEFQRWLLSFANEHYRWGYRRVFIHARREGFSVGRDAFRRMWRQLDLRVWPRKYHKKSLQHTHQPRVEPAQHPGDVWALDFQFDSDWHGRTVKICNVIDEFTRQHITFRVDRSITATDVIEMLDVASIDHGRPRVLRMDNGPEFISKHLAAWAAESDTTLAFIPPGMPWHNGLVESFHNRLRDELFEDNLFNDARQTRDALAWWSKRYNEDHPHSALRYQTPNEFAATWHEHHKQPVMS